MKKTLSKNAYLASDSMPWCVCLTLLGLAAAEDPAGSVLVRFEYTQTQMGVPVKMLLYAPDKATANRAADRAYARIAALNRLLSDYDPESELNRLSHADPAAGPVRVSNDLWRVLEPSQQLSKRSRGAFDVTVGPYVKLWRRARREKQMPAAEQLAQAREKVGYRLLTLDKKKQTAHLARPGMKLDLGGIAMGYAVDEALEVLKQNGVTRALIDGSGDIGASGPPPGEKGWKIGIAPLAADQPPSRDLLLAHAAVTTSGDAFQFVELDGKRYSHIIDPYSGLGLTRRSAVVVAARDCITADSLATAASVLGPEAGLKLVDETPGAAALFLSAAGDKTADMTGDAVNERQSTRFKDLDIRPR